MTQADRKIYHVFGLEKSISLIVFSLFAFVGRFILRYFISLLPRVHMELNHFMQDIKSWDIGGINLNIV